MLKINIDSSKLDEFTQGIIDHMGHLSQPFEQMAASIEGDLKDHIAGHIDLGYEGVDWAPLKYRWANGVGGAAFENIVRRKVGRIPSGRHPWNTPHQELVWSGALMSSIHTLNLDDTSLTVGSDLMTDSGYHLGSLMQSGWNAKGTQIAPRPWAYIDNSMLRQIASGIAQWILEGLT